MEYTISFDASLKIKKGQEKGYINHLARDVFDNENGYSLQHSNENINSKLTNENQTFVNDGNGGFKEMESIKEATDYLDERLDTVKKKLRKDAVIARPLIVQLDKEYVEKHGEDGVINGLNYAFDWVTTEFGVDNIVCASLHMDETNPHMHIMFTPVTEDGRLSQKDWFKSPATLRKQHDDLRKHMQDNGYNATNQRVTGGRKGLPIDEFKTFMTMQDKITEMVDKELELVGKEKALKERSKALLESRQVLSRDRSALSKDKIDIVRRKKALNARETDLEERSKDIDTLASEISLKGKKAAQRVIDEARKRAKQVEEEAKERAKQMEEEAKERAEAIEEHAKMEAKRLRTGAKAIGRKVDKIADKANEIQQSDRGRQAERFFGL